MTNRNHGIVKRGSTYSVVLDLGPGIYRTCPACRHHYWLRDDRTATTCKRDGAELGPPTAGRRQKWVGGFKTVAAAKAARDAARNEIHDGTFVAPTDETLGEFLEAWLSTRQLEQTTAANYAVNVRAYVQPRLGSVKMGDVTPDVLDRFYAELLTSGSKSGGPLAPKTVRNCHLVLHRAFQTAVKARRLTYNPADGCDAVPASESRQSRERRMREEVWTPVEIRTFLDAVADDRLYAGFRLMAHTGLRRGELLGLGWPAVDLEGGTIRVERALVMIGQTPTLKGTKTDASSATIAIDSRTVAALRAHRKAQAREQLEWGPAYTPSDLVFTTEGGGPVNPTAFLRRFQRLSKRAGLRVVRLHTLRHAYASALLRSGAPMKVISERLRHSGIGITADLYTHLAPELDREHAEAGAAFIDGEK